MKNQRERIVNYMEEFGSITPLEAFQDLGITKLATRISELIRDGVAIKKTPLKVKNRYGENCYIMKYELAE